MNAPNNFRSVLFEMAMFVWPRRHAANKMESRNVRDKLHSFFIHGRSWRKWVKEQKLSNG